MKWLKIIRDVKTKRKDNSIEELVQKKDTLKLAEVLCSQDPTMCIRAALAINLYCPTCTTGVLLPYTVYGYGTDFDFALEKLYPGEFVRQYHCNVCSLSSNLGIKWIQSALASARPIRHGGTLGRDRALRLLRVLENQKSVDILTEALDDEYDLIRAFAEDFLKDQGIYRTGALDTQGETTSSPFPVGLLIEAYECSQREVSASDRDLALHRVAEAWAQVDIKKALEIAEEIKDSQSKQGTLADIAKVAAQVDVDRALQIAELISDQRFKSTLLGIAKILAEANSDRAAEVAERAVQLGRYDHEFFGDPLVFVRLTDVYAKLDPERAREYAGRAIKCASNFNKKAIFSQIAQVLVSLDQQWALEMAERAIDSSGYKRSDSAGTLHTMAEAFAREKPARAREFAERAVRTANQDTTDYSDYSLEYAARAIALFNYTNAIQLVQRINEPRSRAVTLQNIAVDLSTSNVQQAMETAELISEKEDPDLKAEALAAVAKALAKVNPKQAGQILERALRLAQSSPHRKSYALKDVAEAFVQLDIERAATVSRMVPEKSKRVEALVSVVKEGMKSDSRLQDTIKRPTV